MIELIDKFSLIWRFVIILSFLIAIVGFGILFYVKYGTPKNKKKLKKTGVIFFVQVFLIGTIALGSDWTARRLARHEIIEFLNQKNLELKINGSIIDINEANEVIVELKEMRSFAGHHSSPIKQFKIAISNKDKLIILFIRQDSNIENEYWIFWNKYRASTLNEVGRVRTDKFEKYNNEYKKAVVYH